LNTELSALFNAPDEIGRTPRPVTAPEIEEFERSEGVTLPNSLKSFWLNYGSRDLNSTKIFAFKTEVVFPDGKKKKADVNSIAGPGKMIEARQRYIDPLSTAAELCPSSPLPSLLLDLSVDCSNATSPARLIEIIGAFQSTSVGVAKAEQIGVSKVTNIGQMDSPTRLFSLEAEFLIRVRPHR